MNTRPCRISGLTSEKGRKLNGKAARAPYNPSSFGRVTVCIEGVPEPMSLKRSNLVFLPRNIFDGGVGVGRGTICDSTFNAVAIDNMRGVKVAEQLISGANARSLGNLVAAKAHLIANSGRRGDNMGIVIMCTDLNVAEAINRVAVGGDAELAGPSRAKFEQIKPLIRKETGRGQFVFANFRPHRIAPDGFDKDMRWGEARAHAIVSGAAKVYPCFHKQYRDSMEVRFVDEITSPGKVFVRHEIYLDYGPEEAEAYVRNAAALGNDDNLHPSNLAKVDPQAFWSAVLHMKKFCGALDTLGDHDLSSKWKEMSDGVRRSREFWREEAEASGIKLPDAVIAGNCDSNWSSIVSTADHGKIASGCANIALLMMIKAASRGLTQTDESSLGQLKPVQVEMLEYYRGYEIDRLASALSIVSRMKVEHQANGETLRQDDYDQLFRDSLEQVGLGIHRDALKYCGHCGKAPANQGDLKMCSKCNGAAYCDRECQTAAWKTHKRECDPFVAQTRQVISRLAEKHGIGVDVQLYKPTGSLPTQPCVFSETSGTGCVGIMWNPGQTSHINFMDTNSLLSGGPALPSVGDMITFKNLQDLDPPTRFLLACGPLPDINAARGCVDETIALTGGNLSALRMKMVNFTPLEWAAKKGNASIVEWLCTDERTKCLVKEGCPVGWACYTGQVDIARKLVRFGADPSKTDAVLFYNAPPLLVAAENGKLEAMKLLVDELGQDIHMVGPSGLGVLESIECPPNWEELDSHREACEWARSRME